MTNGTVKSLYILLERLYPGRYHAIRGRQHSTALFDFEVKTRRRFGKTLARGDGLFAGPFGLQISLRKGSNALAEELAKLAERFVDRRIISY